MLRQQRENERSKHRGMMRRNRAAVESDRLIAANGTTRRHQWGILKLTLPLDFFD